MATTSKKVLFNLSDPKRTFYSAESIQKFLILNRSPKYDSRKMIGQVFTEKKKLCEPDTHSPICDYRTGEVICVECGIVIDKIIGNDRNLVPWKMNVGGLIAKYKLNSTIRNNLELISSVCRNSEFGVKVLARSLRLFQDANNKIYFEREMTPFYALSCVYRALLESNCLVFPHDLLEYRYKNIRKNITNKFYQFYNHLIEKLGLVKIKLQSDDYLIYLSKKFNLDNNNIKLANSLLTKTKNLLPAGKRMNTAVAGGVFYTYSRMNDLNISQKQIAETLKISKGAVCEYTKSINGVLSNAYFNGSDLQTRHLDFR